MRRLIFGIAFLLSASVTYAQENEEWCGTPSPSAAEAESFVEELRRADLSFIPKAPRAIPIAFHVLHDGRNGKVTRQQADGVIDNLNWAFRDSPFTFYLSQFDSRKNPTWYRNCVVNFKNQKRLRQILALDVRRHINVYSCKPGLWGLLGISTFPPGYPVPGNPGHTYMQGIAVDPAVLGSANYPYGLILAHEIGHYLGLFHTFESFFNPGNAKCAEPGDFVDDTPAQWLHSAGRCPVGFDSCIDLPGDDDIENFMNYSTEECMDHFSPGQVDRMLWAVESYRSVLGTR